MATSVLFVDDVKNILQGLLTARPDWAEPLYAVAQAVGAELSHGSTVTITSKQVYFERVLPCGHPRTSIRATDEGTHYCIDCEVANAANGGGNGG